MKPSPRLKEYGDPLQAADSVGREISELLDSKYLHISSYLGINELLKYFSNKSTIPSGYWANANDKII